MEQNNDQTVEQLADEIFNRVNTPEQVGLLEDLQRNTYEPKGGLILNQDVIIAANVVEPYRPPFVGLPGKALSIIPYLNVIVTDKGILSSVYESAKTVAAGVRLENIIMPQGDMTYTEETVKATNIGGYIMVTEESINDAVFLKNEINNHLRRETELILSNHVLNGNGTLPQMAGMIATKSTAFAAGAFAGKVPNATLLDVLKAAGAMILNAGFKPTLAIVSPDDYTTMQFGFNEMQSADFIILPTSQMTAGNYLLIDGSLVSLFLTNQLIKFNPQNADNVLYNRVTITSSLQAMLKVNPIHYAGLVKGVFATDLAAIKATT